MADSGLYNKARETIKMHIWLSNHSKTYPSGMQNISPYQKEILSSKKPRRTYSSENQQNCKLSKENKIKKIDYKNMYKIQK